MIVDDIICRKCDLAGTRTIAILGRNIEKTIEDVSKNDSVKIKNKSSVVINFQIVGIKFDNFCLFGMHRDI